ncbi:MAG: flagellar basal body P-ring formation chaperone FlgA [Planctomycetota bacterium]
MTEALDLERLWGLGSALVEELFRGTDASIKRDGELAAVEIPVGETPLDMRTTLVESTIEAGPKTAAVQLWIDGDLYRTVHLPFNVSLREPRWVLKQSIPAGQVLDPSLFEMRRVEVSFETAQHGLPVEALTGTVAARPLAASTVVTERDIQRPVVIRRGEIVTVIVRSGGLTARDMGTAVIDGRVGDMVRVTLTSTKHEITGRVKASGEVEIIVR